MPVAGPTAPTRRAFAELLAEARTRTVLLVSSLSAEQFTSQPDPEVGSVLSELERIVLFEERVLLENSGAQPAVASYDEWYDRMTDVRHRALQRLDELELGDDPAWQDRLRLVLEHEYQRGERILESLQVQGNPYHPHEQRRLPRGRRLADPGIMARFPGGTIQIGADAGSTPWPEEQPVHAVAVEPFWIDLMPVTNGDFLTFMGEGGYTERDLWSEDGWHWLKQSQAQMPRDWSWQDGAWWSRRLGRDAPIDFTCPVEQVSFYEAEAFARFVGKRLPSEIEWEAAATWDPETQSRRDYPWGNMPPSFHVANLDQLAFGPAAVGAFPGNMSPIGCYGMIGDVWEWTASEFTPYPGSSEPAALMAGSVFSPDSKVLRGGSWATRPGAVRSSSRHPAAPHARSLFSGFRCARDQ
jgi:iron(II)-dependent oxidoreductase